MLKYIRFVLSTYDSNRTADDLEAVQKEVEPYGIQVSCGGIKENQYAETLYITDDAMALNELIACNAYVIVLYHEYNHNQDFSAAAYGFSDVKNLEYSSYKEAYERMAGLSWDILETSRLKIRESTVDDVEGFYQIYEDPSITYYMENLYDDPDKERAYMQDYIKQIYGFYGFGLWTILRKDTEQIIGRAGLSIRSGYDLPELGFVIGKNYQHNGYALEACRAILIYAKDKLEFDCIQALTKEENMASRNLLNKLGFRQNGEAEVKGENYLLYLCDIKP